MVTDVFRAIMSRTAALIPLLLAATALSAQERNGVSVKSRACEQTATAPTKPVRQTKAPLDVIIIEHASSDR